MGFFKDSLGVVFFCLAHILIFCSILFVYYTTDESSSKYNAISTIEFTSYLLFHKIIFYFFTFFVIYCHLKASTTDPGKITHQTNPRYIDFYLCLYESSMNNAIEYTRQRGEKSIQEILKKLDEEGGNDSGSEYDDKEYEPVTTITDENMNKIMTKYKLRLNRCPQCYVVRPNRAHHCPSCRGCILNMDHHCPWINNCVGQFNKKYFLLLNFYLLLGCSESLFICGYYSIYKNYTQLPDNIFNILFVLGQLLICLIFGVFAVIMLFDQKDTIENDTVFIDYKSRKILEKRTFGEELYEIFGGNFGLNWFLPFKCGGFKSGFNSLDTRTPSFNK